MKPEIITIFVEDYKKMSKEQFSDYIKQIYQQGYDKGYQDGLCNLTVPTYYNNHQITPCTLSHVDQ